MNVRSNHAIAKWMSVFDRKGIVFVGHLNSAALLERLGLFGKRISANLAMYRTLNILY